MILIILVITLLISCTKYSRLPDSYFKDTVVGKKQVIRISTIKNERYEFRKYYIIKDTLIIIPSQGNISQSKEIAVPFKEISSIEKCEIQRTHTVILLSIMVIGVVAFFLFIASVAALGNLR